MGQIDWSVLGQFGGGAIEDFIAACLCQRYKTAQQVKPGRGDGGIDIWRRTGKGITNWQVKKFTTPLTSSQWGQVESSWKRFNETWVDEGHAIKKFYLVTPWTPTPGALEKFNILTKGAGFPTHWSGEAFIDGLASEFPGTYARFFKGEDFLEKMVMQKAVLAGLPIEQADSVTMLEAISRKENDLAGIRQLVSDNYNVDHGYITTVTGDFPPMPGPESMGLMHRYTYLGDNRFKYETVVPKTSQAGENEPISLSLAFRVEPGSPEADAIIAWQEWGVPFNDIPATVQNNGGPLADDVPHDSFISFVQPPYVADKPDLLLIAVKGDEEGPPLRLRATEVTSGSVTGWKRIVATSPSGVIQVDSRLGSEEVGLSLKFTLLEIQGREVDEIIGELAWVENLIASGGFALKMEGVGTLASGTGGAAPEQASIFISITKALSSVQHAIVERLRVPDLSEVTEREYRDLLAWAEIFSGNAQGGVWRTREIRKPPAGHAEAQAIRALVEGRSGSFGFYPRLKLGGREIQINKRVVQTLLSYKIGGDRSYDQIAEGEHFDIVPDKNDEIMTAAVVDDELAVFVEGDVLAD